MNSIGAKEARFQRPPARAPLDRRRILGEAIFFIDTYGLPQLTMRRLGTHLGVEAMALYRYVPGREQLLDGVVDTLMEQLYSDTMQNDPPQSWSEYLQQMAHAVRRMAQQHPKIFPMVATRPPSAPWLRPPLRSLRWVESFLQALRGYGFSPGLSVSVYRSFATYLLGNLMVEASSMGGDESILPAEDEIELEPEDLNEYPQIRDLETLLRQDGFDSEFEDSLEDLINRIAVLRGLPGSVD